MTDERYSLAELIAACWKDDALKARFLADPKAVLSERGIEVPAHLDVKVVENTDDTVHITLPAAPSGAGLSDDELVAAAGGGGQQVDKLGPSSLWRGGGFLGC